MNQSNQKQKSFSKTLVFSVLVAVAAFSATFVILAYLVFLMPNYEDLIGLFPFAVMVAGSALIALISQLLARNFLPMSLILSSSISIISLILRFSLFPVSGKILGLISWHIIFILIAVLFQFLLIKKSPHKKRSKNLPFRK